MTDEQANEVVPAHLRLSTITPTVYRCLEHGETTETMHVFAHGSKKYPAFTHVYCLRCFDWLLQKHLGDSLEEADVKPDA